MHKQKWDKITKYKEETLYKGLKLVIVNKDTPSRYEHNKLNWCWHGYVYDQHDKIIPTAFKQLNRYKLTKFVVESRNTLIKLIDDNWYHYSGDKAKDDAAKANEESLLVKRRYVMQNIHYYVDLFPTGTEINANSMWPIIKFALDNFDDCEQLFNAKKQLAEVLLNHYREQNKWRSLPKDRRQREVFSHVENDTISHVVHDVSSYWGYDEKYRFSEPTTRYVYTDNPQYVSEPVYPFKKTEVIEKLIRELSAKLYQLAKKVDFTS